MSYLATVTYRVNEDYLDSEEAEQVEAQRWQILQRKYLLGVLTLKVETIAPTNRNRKK